ncbi:MAG: hypothetical protein Q4D81_08240, partial [Eubacteriales bacterium]|nr:hypothetical protein [Eubacteriales bacterium]
QERQVSRVLARLNRAAERFHSDRRFTADDILAKEWEAFTAEDYARIVRSGMVPSSHYKLPVERESGYGTLFYYGISMDEDVLRRKTAETLADPACGDVMRIKGFVRIGDGARVQVNATRSGVLIEPTFFAQEVLIITGENLRREPIDRIWAEHAEVITPGNTVM